MAKPVAVRSASDKRAKAHALPVAEWSDVVAVTTCGTRLPAPVARAFVLLSEVPPEDRCKRCWPGSAR